MCFNDEKLNSPDLLLSYSRISDFDRNGPRALIERTISKSRALTKGSLCDDMLFNKENLYEKYHFTDVVEPTASLKKLVDIINLNYTTIPTLEEVDDIVVRNELWKSTKTLSTRRKNYDKEEFWNYLDLLFNHSDKIVVTDDLKVECEELVFILENFEYSKHYFNPPEHIEIIPQFQFEITEEDYVIRGFFDMLYLDHKNKTIKIVDLKTGSGNSTEFYKSFIKYRYYIQEAVYSSALAKLLQTELKDYQDYEILDFEFLFIGKDKIPVVYKCDEFWQRAAREGFYGPEGRYKGVEELTNNIIWHWKNNKFDLPIEFYQNNGVLTLEKSHYKL